MSSNTITIVPPETGVLERSAAELVAAARGCKVTGPQEHGDAQQLLRNMAALRASFVEAFAPAKKAAHEGHKAICALEARFIAPLDEARGFVQPKVIAYEEEAQRRAEAERIRLEAELRKEEEARRLNEAIAAEEAGVPPEVTDEILEAPVVAPPVYVPPQTAQVKGVARTVTWSAQVEDLHALVRFVAEKKEWLNLLTVNQSALNSLAKSQKELLSLPGVRVVKTAGMAVRK